MFNFEKWRGSWKTHFGFPAEVQTWGVVTFESEHVESTLMFGTVEVEGIKVPTFWSSEGHSRAHEFQLKIKKS